MSQGVMSTMGTVGIEKREIQILADAESHHDTSPDYESLHVENGANGRNNDTSYASIIAQATFNPSDDGQSTFNSSADGQPMFDYVNG
jgi:hypothetical protein